MSFRVADTLGGVRGFEICSGSEAGSYVRLIDFGYHSTLGLRIIQKKKKYEGFGTPKFLGGREEI